MTLLEFLDKKFDAPGLALFIVAVGFFAIIALSAAMHYLAVCVRGWPPQEECVKEEDAN